MTILTLTPLPHGCYTGKIIVNGCLYAGTFAGVITIGNVTINWSKFNKGALPLHIR